MVVKLIKTSKDQYHIESKEFDGAHLACYPHDITKQKLSLKNCQAIDRDYNLDELISAELEKLPYTKHLDDGQYNDGQLVGFEMGAYWGFQTALEILGDKEFSEEDMRDAIQFGLDDMYGYKQGKQGHTEDQKKKYIQSIQQTEWDVEIVKEQYVKYVPKSIITVYPTGGVRLKVDEDGCLILKKI